MPVRKQKDLTANLVIVANLRGLQQSLNRAGTDVRTFANSTNKSLLSIGTNATVTFGVITGAITAATTRIVNAADQIAKSAKALGFQADQYQKLVFAIERVGGDLAAIERGILRFQKQLAGVGDQEGVKVFEQLGLSVSEFRKLAPEESFQKITTELSKLNDVTQRNALTMDLFGTRGSKAINLLVNDMRAYQKELTRAGDIGAIFGDRTLENAQETKDAFGDLIAVMERGFADGALKDSIERTENLDTVLKAVGDTIQFLAGLTVAPIIDLINGFVNLAAADIQNFKEITSILKGRGGTIEFFGDSFNFEKTPDELFDIDVAEFEERAKNFERLLRSGLDSFVYKRDLQVGSIISDYREALEFFRPEIAGPDTRGRRQQFENRVDIVRERVQELEKERQLLYLSNELREIRVRVDRDIAKGLSDATGALTKQHTLNVQTEAAIKRRLEIEKGVNKALANRDRLLEKQKRDLEALLSNAQESIDTFGLSDRGAALFQLDKQIESLRALGNATDEAFAIDPAQIALIKERINAYYDLIDAEEKRLDVVQAFTTFQQGQVEAENRAFEAAQQTQRAYDSFLQNIRNQIGALNLSGEALVLYNLRIQLAESNITDYGGKIEAATLALYRQKKATEELEKAKAKEAEVLKKAQAEWAKYIEQVEEQEREFIQGEANKIIALNRFADALRNQNVLLQLDGVDKEIERAVQQYGELPEHVVELIRLNYELKNSTDEAIKGLSYQAEQMQKIWDNMVRSMQQSFETVIYNTLWEDGIDSFSDFGKAILDTWKRVVAQMVAAWATSGITRILQGGGIAGGLLGGAGSALASNGGGGVLSGLLGNFGGGGGGGILNTLGSSFRSLGGLFGAGGGALAGFYSGAGATAAIGGSALGGATGAATAGGLAGSIGAALPAIGAVALAFSFFSSKTKELDNGIRITIDNMDVLAESYRRVQKSRFFGLSKKTREYYDEASDEITALFQEGIDTVRDSVGGVFNIFGLATDSLDDFSAQFKVSLKDLSDTERTEAIEEALRDIANQMTSAAFSANGLNLTLEESEAAMERLALAGELVVAAAERADAINEGRLDGLGAFQSQIESLTTQGLSDVLDEVSLELDTELSNEFERFVRDINSYLGTDSDNQITSLQQAADEIANRIEDAKRDLEREREAVLKITDDIERGAREFQVSQNEAALQGLRNLFDEVTTQLESIGGREFETLTTLSQAISDEFDKRGQQRIETSLITRLLDRADVVVAGINDLAAAASEATDQAFDFITGLIDSAGGHVSEQTETLTNALIDSISRYISTVTSASHLVNNYGSGIVDNLAEDVKNARQALSDAVPSVTQSIVDTVNQVIEQVTHDPNRGGDGPSGGVGGPGFATGGIVPGARGEPMLAVVHGGEEILTPMQRGQRDEPINITINVQGDADTMVVRAIERHVRDVASMIGSVR